MSAILKVTAKVTGPQQMYKHTVLFEAYVALLGYSDSLAISAFSSLLRFKPEYLLPHCEPIKKLFSKGKMRESLLQLKEMKAEGVIPKEHRHRLVPLLTRILLGRVSSRNTTRSAKDTPAARRVAIFSFLSAFCDGYNEIYPSIYLSVRQFAPAECLKSIATQSDEDRKGLCHRMSYLRKEECELQPIAVQEGFLNVLEAIISQLGHQIQPFVPIFLSIVLSLLETHAIQVESTFERKHRGELQHDALARSGHIRMLCCRRLAEMFDRFASVHDFSSTFSRFWKAVEPSLPGLPESAASSEKTPALIDLLHTLSSHSSLLPAFQQSQDAVEALIKSLGSAKSVGVVDTILGFIENLIGIPDPDIASDIGKKIMKEHLDSLLKSFQQRISDSLSPATLRREIAVLCGISNTIVKDDALAIKNHSVDSLAELMIPYLGLKSRLSEKDRSNVVAVLLSLVPGIGEATARSLFQTLSVYLGPAKTSSLSLADKFSIAEVLRCIATHHLPLAESATIALVALFKMNTKRVGELDYDSSISVMQQLSNSKGSFSWEELCSQSVEWVVPIIYSCFQFLYDEDGVQTRTAVKALKDLVTLSSTKVRADNVKNEAWMKLLEGMIMPLIRSGLKTKTQNVRRLSVQLLSSTIADCQDLASSHLHNDLIPLINHDNSDLDFFHGICHVQIHRRARAFTRLRRFLSAEDAASVKISVQSTSLILLPLALHPIYETKTKEEDAFALEAVAAIGVLSRHLSWSKYNTLIGTLLNQFQRHPEQEKYLVGAICSILDNMDFELEGNDPDSGSTVLRTLEKRILPKTQELLTKEVRKGGRVERTIRPSIALALLKLCLRLPRKVFLIKLQQLLTVLCGALRNRDSSVREVSKRHHSHPNTAFPSFSH
jgi:U3 small nucleolar RNA-associated protein 20